MIATIDMGPVAVTGLRRPKPDRFSGLRWCQVALLPALAARRPPSLRRAVLLAFWDDEDAAARVADLHPLGRLDGDGFHASLRPLRAHGTWPGLDDDITRARRVDHSGDVIVLTLGHLRITQTARFFRASRPAERAALAAPGFRWGTAAARPPFVATITAWNSDDAAAGYAYGESGPHDAAIEEQRRKDFHRQSAFIRFAPINAPLGVPWTSTSSAP